MNSKIYKIQCYVVDIHGEYEENHVKFLIDQYSDLFAKHFKVESADIGEWHDEHPLNYINSPIEECEKYFKGV